MGFKGSNLPSFPGQERKGKPDTEGKGVEKTEEDFKR